jgi:CheY-like chemotaxis protein
MTLDELHEGMQVLYIPPHAHGDRTHPDGQRGIVTSMNATQAFVRYGDDRHSQATLPVLLVPADHPGRETARRTPLPCLLVITEDLEKRRTWRRLFVHAGYAVMDARHAQEGLHYLQTHAIDLVVLELAGTAPHVQATLQALRTGAPTLRILLLFDLGVTGPTAEDLLRQRYDADRVLTQPVSEAGLLASVRTARTVGTA